MLVLLLTHLDEFSVVMSIGHEGELAEEGQTVLPRLVEFQFIRLPHIPIVRPVAHWKAENIENTSTVHRTTLAFGVQPHRVLKLLRLTLQLPSSG
jgi:hypothetical protein